MIELLGTQSAQSARREGARRVVMFLTDGQPTLPIDGAMLQNAKMAIDHATRARKFDIRIDTFALGPEALEGPVAVVEMARVTQGTFYPVQRPSDLRVVFEEIKFSEIAELKVFNQTTGQDADYTLENADGTFSALLPMKEGRNVLEVYARATDGSEARRHIGVTYLPGGDAQELTLEQVAQRNRLLESRLRDLKQRRLELQVEVGEEARKQLQVEIERQRAEAEERAAEQRRELDLELEKDRPDTHKVRTAPPAEEEREPERPRP
jgi:hypothetical protein